MECFCADCCFKLWRFSASQLILPYALLLLLHLAIWQLLLTICATVPAAGVYRMWQCHNSECGHTATGLQLVCHAKYERVAYAETTSKQGQQAYSLVHEPHSHRGPQNSDEMSGGTLPEATYNGQSGIANRPQTVHATTTHSR